MEKKGKKTNWLSEEALQIAVKRREAKSKGENIVKWQDIKSTHRNPLHSYTPTKKTEREIKETIPFTIATKKNK